MSVIDVAGLNFILWATGEYLILLAARPPPTTFLFFFALSATLQWLGDQLPTPLLRILLPPTNNGMPIFA